jgi:RND family efflux transporter MFP subunit
MIRRILKNRWLPLLILLVGLIVSGVVAATGPSAPRRTPQRQARLVEVMPLEAADTQVVVEALGTVQPALGVRLQAQVGGQVVDVSPSLIPGGRVAEGEVLLRIDPREHEFAVRQRQSDLARAEQALRLEKSQQGIARREYELMGDVAGDGDSELMLRKPQLETASTAYDAALAAFEQAQLNLERTSVVAPFNAVVEERLVDRGSVVGANTAVASLVGTDACWVEAMVPADEVAWIAVRVPGGVGGSLARIRQDATWDEGVWRDGRVLGRSSTIDAQGRMVKVIIEVEDPFSLRRSNAGEPALLVGSFVDVEIFGETIRNAVVVDRTYVHDGDRVWLMDDKGNLVIRTIDPAYVGDEQVVVTEGLDEGDRMVTSHLSAPVEGMPLRLRGEDPSGGDGPSGGADETPTGEDKAEEVPGR